MRLLLPMVGAPTRHSTSPVATQKDNRLAETRRQTFGEAQNAGAVLANGTFLVFIDADVIIPSPQSIFLKKYAKVFEKNIKLVATTAPLKPVCRESFLDRRILLCPTQLVLYHFKQYLPLRQFFR